MRSCLAVGLVRAAGSAGHPWSSFPVPALVEKIGDEWYSRHPHQRAQSEQQDQKPSTLDLTTPQELPDVNFPQKQTCFVSLAEDVEADRTHQIVFRPACFMSSQGFEGRQGTVAFGKIQVHDSE